ncbi:PilZ domain-containing protein [Paenibacillus oenotherae]|uniref:PilZ domain-containing protein n=1 Tax=Paenibacillus oenotherae TaxID=1435645 RepID=A0ABS7DA92_9BACL|nr:PilZ domain-containing protein [Paenibacillus oenotherae]MBW7476775.1 PilZ domain-containing protein [Paenibacillus oenotherae]
MVDNRSSNKDAYGADKGMTSTKVLVHSRTVVEKEGYVSTGVLSHVEGEMIEIEMSEYKSFDLGDPVSLTIYSPVGIHRMQSTIIGKAEGSLAVIFPPRSLIGLEEKREMPRIEVYHDGLFRPVTGDRSGAEAQGEAADEEELVESALDFELTVRNISFSGIGFQVFGQSALEPDDRVKATIKIGFELSCTLEIVRKEYDGEQSFYGARFQNLDELQQRALRAFLLREQVATYYKKKQEKSAKPRSF